MLFLSVIRGVHSFLTNLVLRSDSFILSQVLLEAKFNTKEYFCQQFSDLQQFLDREEIMLKVCKLDLVLKPKNSLLLS